MGGCDFDCASTEGRVDVIIGDDAELEGMAEDGFGFDFLPDVFGVAFVLGVDGDGGIAEFGLGADGGENEGAILDVVERVLLLSVLDFDVGEARATVCLLYTSDAADE